MKTNPHQNGFSLLELVIAVSIFSVGLLALAAMTTSVINGNRISKNFTVAVTLAQTKLDDLRALDYDEIIHGTENQLDETGAVGMGIFTRVVTVESSNTNPTYKTVSVTVSWTDLSAKHVVLKSLIAP